MPPIADGVRRTALTDELGAKNVFDDTHEEWPQINWETVADRNPDVLVIGDLTRKSQTAESAEKKIEFLESNPASKNLDAVKHKRYVLLSGQAMNPTIRTVEGAERVVAGGTPSEVITEELIADVYRVRAVVTPEGPGGRPTVRFLPGEAVHGRHKCDERAGP